MRPVLFLLAHIQQWGQRTYFDRPLRVPRVARCETFELRDRVSEACEAFIENSPVEDEDADGGDGKEGQDTSGATALRIP